MNEKQIERGDQLARGFIRKRPGTLRRDVRDRRDTWLVYLIYVVGLVCLVKPPLRVPRRKVKAKVEVEGERGDGSD